MTGIPPMRSKLIDWVKNDALPFWATKGLDPKGGAWEKLDLEGNPIEDSIRRVRVQARQVYVYSHAHALGWYPEAQKVSDHIWSYLTTKGFQGKDIGCAHLLNPDGSIHNPLRDTYAQAFLILASTWRWHAFKDTQAKDILYQTTDFLNNDLKAQNSGWLESDQHALPRRQNPHMHLFEAFIAAYEITGDSSFLQLADDVFDLFKKHFFEEESKCLLEFFEEDWSPDAQTGQLTEPGHMLEWCWLLNNYGRVKGLDVTDYSEPLYNMGIKLGTMQTTGLICNQTDIHGKVTDSNCRFWPQTEYVKANVSRIENGSINTSDDIEKMLGLIFKYYLDEPPLGGWHDERSSTGALVSNTMPSSTFYHIFCMAAELEKLTK